MFLINFFIFNLIFLNNLMAFDGCGTYKLQGVFIKSPDSIKKSFYIVNFKTNSELKFKIQKPIDLAKLMLHENQATSIKVSITKPMDNTLGEIEKILSVEPRVTTSLQEAKGNNMVKIESLKCHE